MGIMAEYAAALTCGEACWSAREDICRCSCAGANHGCNRGENGERPQRMCTIKGRRFLLIATGTGAELGDEIDARIPHDGNLSPRYWHADYIYDESGLRERKASKSAIAAWPELARFRDNPPERWQDEARTLWIAESRA